MILPPVAFIAFVRVKLALRLEDAIRARAKANKERSGREHGNGKVPQISAEPILPVETREELAKANQVRKPSDSVQQKSAEQKLPIEILEVGVRGAVEAEIIKKRFSRFLRNRSPSKPAKVAGEGAAFTVRPLARGPTRRKK